MDLGVVLRSKLEQKSTKNLSKRVSKIEYDFEWILDGSWTDFGSILEAKLALTSVQEGAETDVKKMSKKRTQKDDCGITQDHARSCG